MQLFKPAALAIATILTTLILCPAQGATYSNIDNNSSPIYDSTPALSYTFEYDGQVFVSPGGTLTDFQFHVTGGNAGNYYLNIASWVDDGLTLTAVGPRWKSQALYYDGVQNTIGSNNIYVSTTEGATYIAFLSSAFVANPTSNVGIYFTSNDNAGIGQGMTATFDLRDPVAAHSGWHAPDYANYQFSAEFVPTSAIPEPETYAMFLAGLGLMGFAARRRKNQA